jgi:divalent anion:Na+ symporter, DASS family
MGVAAVRLVIPRRLLRACVLPNQRSLASLERTVWLRLAGGALGAAVACAALIALKALGVSPEAAKVLAILAGAAVFWALHVVPEVATALLVCALARISGAAPLSVAFSGFSDTFFLMAAIFGLSALIARSGLGARAALLGMKLFPATYRGQAWALACSGLMASALLPASLGRLTVIGPVVVAIKGTLRLPDRSREAAGLGLIACLSYGQMSFAFMNGTPACFVIFGLLPPAVAAKITWLDWLLIALPLSLVIFLGNALIIVRRFRPAIEVPAAPGSLDAKLASLGKPARQEKLALLGLVMTLGVLLLKPFHGAEPGRVALILLLPLLVWGAGSKVLKAINYQYLVYFGAFQSIAAVIRGAGADKAMVAFLSPHLQWLGASPYVLLPALALIAYTMTSLVPGFPGQPVLIIAASPLAKHLGYNPFVCGLVVLTTLMPGLMPSASVGYQAFHNATERIVLKGAYIREAALFHVPIVILGVVSAIPFWRALGMIP